MTLSSSDAPRSKTGGRVRRAAQAGRSAFLWFIFASICTLAAVLSLARWWLPSYVEDNQRELVSALSANLGGELSAEETRLRWSHWGPSLQLTSLRLDVAGGGAPLTLDTAEVSLDIRQLLQNRQLVVDAVTLRGVNFEIRRDADGSWQLAFGSEQGGGASLDATLAALSRFGWINIEDASLRIKDDKTGTDSSIDNINVVVNNRTGQTRVSLDADFPEAVGGHLRAVAILLVDPEDGVSGRTYLSVDRVELGFLAEVLGAKGIMPDGEVRDTQAWALLRSGQVENFQVQMAGERVALKDAAGEGQWDIDFFSGGAGWQRTESGWQAWLADVVLARDGVAWRPGLTTVEQRADELIAGGQLLRVDALRDAVQPWRSDPALADVAAWFEAAQPSGEVALWKLSLPLEQPGHAEADSATPGTPAYSLPEGLRFEAVLSDWKNQRFESLPGVDNVNAAIRFIDGRFSVRLEGVDSTVDMPDVFRVPIEFEQLNAQFDGNIRETERWLYSDSIIADTPHFRMNASISLAPSSDQRGVDMDVRAAMRDLDGRYVSNYYPIGAMNRELQAWLEASLLGGRYTKGELLLSGNSADYPFRDNNGRMDLRLTVEDLGMRYHADWPALSDMSGEFVLDGIGVSYEGRAKVLGGTLESVSAEIPAFKAARMNFDSQWRGESTVLLNWLRDGPLAKSVGRHFQDVEISGPVALRLAPDFGLKPGMAGRLSGTARLSGAAVDLLGPDLSFTDVASQIPFNEKGVLDHEVSGNYLGRPVNAVVTTSEDQREVRIDAATSIDLGPWLGERGVPVASWFDGESEWDLSVGIVSATAEQPTQLSIDAYSDLIGVQVTAPDPLAKEASEASSLRVRADFAEGADDQWRIGYGEDLSLSMVSRDKALRALALGAGMPAPTLPERGVRARIDVDSADLERWYTALDSCCIDDEAEDTGSVDVYLRVDNATWLGAPVGKVDLQLQDDGDALFGQVSGDTVEGRFRYKDGDAALVQADLTRLDVTRLKDAEFEISEVPPTHPRDYPRSEISVREFKLDGLRFTDIYLTTQPTVDGMALSDFVLRSPLYTAQGSGQWTQDAAGVDTSVLELFGRSDDIGLAVADMGRVGTLTGGSAELNIATSWRGELWAPDFESLAGKLNFNLADGRVNDVDPGAGRVFGLLALQTLPQRLSLDFSDLGDGLGYERVTGDFELRDGKAIAKAMLLEGPVGVVSVAGVIDYMNREYDQRIVVLPNVGGSLPLIGAFVGGPVTAASVFLADKILRNIGVDVNQLGRQDYSLTGDFDSPELDLIVFNGDADQ